MTKKFHILVLIVIVGFFLMPSITFACEMNSGKSCCNKEISASDNLECCKDSQQFTNTNRVDHKGKSKHSACNCFVNPLNVMLPFETKINSEDIISFDNKDKFIEIETNISIGFQSIWLIPKIS